MAHGIDDRPVHEDRQRKSLGAERTFDDDLNEEAELMAALATIVDTVWERAGGKDDGPARTVTLKLKFADFRQITRSRTIEAAVDSHAVLLRVAAELLAAEIPPPLGIRLMGVTLSGFAAVEAKAEATLPLFADS
jgi:DNA polymerase IV